MAAEAEAEVAVVEAKAAEVAEAEVRAAEVAVAEARAAEVAAAEVRGVELAAVEVAAPMEVAVAADAELEAAAAAAAAAALDPAGFGHHWAGSVLRASTPVSSKHSQSAGSSTRRSHEHGAIRADGPNSSTN